MAIKNKYDTYGIVIDTTGPEGNAFIMIGAAMGYAKQMGLDEVAIRAEMESGDYDNLIKVFDKYFGGVVTLLV